MSYTPELRNKISTLNSVTLTGVTSGQTWVGSAEDVSEYGRIGISIWTPFGESIPTPVSGTLTVEVSRDGVNWGGPNRDFANTAIAQPHMWQIVEKYFRLKYTHGPQTASTLTIQSQLSVNADVVLGHQLDETPIDEHEAQLTKALTIGKNPNGIYTNAPASGVDNNNSTNTPLASGATYTGDWSEVSEYGEIKISYKADVPSGDVYLQLSHDGVGVDTSLNVPAQLVGSSYAAIHALNPSLPYFRVVYNNGDTAQSTFDLTTLLLTNSGNGFISRATQVINRYNDVRLQRVVNDTKSDRNFGLVNYASQQRKFGANTTVSNTAFEDIWSVGGNYPFPSSAETFRVRAGNAADTGGGSGARSIEIDFLDSNWNEQTETILLSGTSASQATTLTGYRILRARVKEVGTYGGSNVGNIDIENTTSNTLLARIGIDATGNPGGLGSTQLSMYTVPAGKTMYIQTINITVGLGNSADVRLFKVEDVNNTGSSFGPKRIDSSFPDISGVATIQLETWLKFDEYTDIVWDAKRITGSGNASVSIEYDFILVDNL